mmetsp:Transcript_16199/g.37254  ORF Transcript_16199/g.37254 Transcript_16199/m.37254 type:complete len:234 (+) Transcript_16199:3983-4684(+)
MLVPPSVAARVADLVAGASWTPDIPRAKPMRDWVLAIMAPDIPRLSFITVALAAQAAGLPRSLLATLPHSAPTLAPSDTKSFSGDKLRSELVLRGFLRCQADSLLKLVTPNAEPLRWLMLKRLIAFGKTCSVVPIPSPTSVIVLPLPISKWMLRLPTPASFFVWLPPPMNCVGSLLGWDASRENGLVAGGLISTLATKSSKPDASERNSTVPQHPAVKQPLADITQASFRPSV